MGNKENVYKVPGSSSHVVSYICQSYNKFILEALNHSNTKASNLCTMSRCVLQSKLSKAIHPIATSHKSPNTWHKIVFWLESKKDM